MTTFRNVLYASGILLILFPSVLRAQIDSLNMIEGGVYDAVTGKVLVGAHVFIIDTTVGVVTDETGSFMLPEHAPGQIIAGVSMLGYSPLIFRIPEDRTPKQRFRIELKPQVYTMKPLTVTGKRNRRWRKQLRTFTREVIGETESARHTAIVNPEVLSFKQRNGVLIAEASEPLIIENRSLGYRVYYSLIHCVVQENESRFKGIARYEEMLPKSAGERKIWEANRKTAYDGSLKHLLRELALGQQVEDVEASGFQLAVVPELPSSVGAYRQALDGSSTALEDIVGHAEKAHEKLLRVNGYLLVGFSGERLERPTHRPLANRDRHAEQQLTSLHVKSDSVRFHRDGYLFDAYSITIQGGMGRERLADMLPADYVPAPERAMRVTEAR